MTCESYDLYRSSFGCVEYPGYVWDLDTVTLAYTEWYPKFGWSIDVFRITRTNPGRYTVTGLLPHLNIIEHGCTFATILEWLRIVSDSLTKYKPPEYPHARNFIGTDGLQEWNLRFPRDDVAAYRGWQDIQMCEHDDNAACIENTGPDVCDFS